MRKHRWVKQESLNYPIPNINQTCDILRKCDWIETEITDIDTALHVLTTKELKNIIKQLHIDIHDESSQVNSPPPLTVIVY